MIICTGCGHSNGASDAFCGSCGGFLEWDGQQVAAPPQPQLARVPAAREQPRVPAPVSARPPEVEHERPAPLRPDPIDLGPADLYCGSCGAGNADGRAFCRRCGAPLADAEGDARLSWWRRVLARLRRSKRSLAAGERPEGWAVPEREAGEGQQPRKRRWWRPRLPARLSLGKLALPLAVLSLVGFGLSPLRANVTQFLFGAWHDGRRVVLPEYVNVTPSGATATSSIAHHDPGAAIDGNDTTWWSEAAPGRGRDQRLYVTFDRPVDLAKVSFYNGAAGADFPLQPRVRGVRITLRGPHGLVGERRTILADKRPQQLVDVSGKGVTRVVISVLSTYAGQEGSAASLADVGFVSKQ